MATFRVYVEKMMLVSGVIEIKASSAQAAEEKALKMIKKMQTNDARIEWDEPEYVDGTFTVTGDID